MIRDLSFIFFLWILSFQVLSQKEITGNYPINNFKKIKTGVGIQTWQIELGKNGLLYFANNGGLLKYDGINWDLFPLPNRTIVRSICISSEEKIFVGGQDEVGYFDSTFHFHSIRELIPSEHLPLEDVWQIIEEGDHLYFRSVDKIFDYDRQEGTIRVISSQNPIISLIRFKDSIYFHQLSKGLISVDDTSRTFPGSVDLRYMQLLNVVEFNGKVLAITESDGIYNLENARAIPFNGLLNQYLHKSKLFTGVVQNNNHLILGTQFDGVIAIDSTGSIIQSLKKSDGLINNNVQALRLDRMNDLWVGTSNGISEVKINSRITYLQPDAEQSSIFYDVQGYRENLYFASNNGIFEYNQATEGFRSIENSFGQAWGLDTIAGNLLIGHNRGAFILDGDRVVQFSERPGGWKFTPTGHQDHIYVGTYQGVEVYKRVGRNYQFVKKLEGFKESSRIMIAVKKNELWISHPYRGVFRITHDDEFESTRIQTYGIKEGLPSELRNYIFNINGVPHVTGKKGIFYYDREADRFLESAQLNEAIDTSQNVSRLFPRRSNEIWFVAEQEVGKIIINDDGSYKKTSFPELVGKFVGGFEQLSFHNGKVYICTDQEIILLDDTITMVKKPPLFNFHQITLAGNTDSVLTFERDIELLYYQNEIQFSYSSPEHSEGVLYQNNLIRDGVNSFSSWSRELEKDFTNLAAGDYIFQVQAMSQDGLQSELKEFHFTILPPWYLSNMAKAIYIAGFLGSLLALVLIPRTRYKKDKEILIAAKKESDQELEKIKTEKLEAELASSTLHLVQKNETMNKIKSELDAFRSKVEDARLRKDLKKVMTIVSDDSKLEDDWQRFSSHFDQVHTNFLKRLVEKYPQITPKDRKLCAYLRMNLSTKEIAPLMHISVRGVEISRYRLRKKLALPKEVNLNEFMMNF